MVAQAQTAAPSVVVTPSVVVGHKCQRVSLVAPIVVTGEDTALLALVAGVVCHLDHRHGMDAIYPTVVGAWRLRCRGSQDLPSACMIEDSVADLVHSTERGGVGESSNSH